MENDQISRSHQMGSLPWFDQLFWGIFTAVIMLLAAYLATYIAPIRFA